MPRTKRTSKSTNTEVRKISTANKLLQKKEVDAYLKEVELNFIRQLEFEDSLHGNVLQELDLLQNQCKMLVPARLGKIPLEDLEKNNSTHFMTATDTVFSMSNLLEITTSMKSFKDSRRKRSISLSDEVHTPVHTRSSRSKSKQDIAIKPSRSLSRNKPQQPRSGLNNFKTPINQAIRNDYGLITPKVKPNTPQVVLRRPKEGEMAISMQGSPLLVNTVISRDANINIPLQDGRTISIQPQTGLRMSQLPEIDGTLREQIEVLRDNLIKVCALSNKKKPTTCKR